MSSTVTNLATTAMSSAFERIETVYDTLVEQLHGMVLSWGHVDADMADVQKAEPYTLVEDIRRAAVTKWTLSRLIRTRPDVLPPSGLTYESIFVSSLIKLGDALTLDEIANAVADLKSHVSGSSWDFDTVDVPTAQGSQPEDGWPSANDDLGEVTPGPADPNDPHDEDAAAQ